MVKRVWLASFIVFGLFFQTFSQRERVFLDFARYSCKAGEGVAFSGIVLKGNELSPLSKNLYVELYRENGILLQRLIFPIVDGKSFGQITFPDSLPTANYFVRALTRQQLNYVNYDNRDFFTVPIMVYNRDQPVTIQHKRQVADSVIFASGTIKGITWISSLYNGKISSLIEVEPGSRPRQLQLVSRLSKDSLAGATVRLDSLRRQQYCLFALHPDRDSETLFLMEDSVLIGHQVIRIRDNKLTAKLLTDTLDFSPYGYDSWRLELPGNGPWHTSISVNDADRSIPSPEPITRLNNSYTDDYTVSGPADTAFVSYIGKATRASGKKIKDKYAEGIIVAGTRDTNYLFTRALNMDTAGNFKLDSLFFFGSIGLRFQINGEQGARGNDVKLSLMSFIPPPADTSLFVSNWEDDEQPINASDTTFTNSELTAYELSKFQTLKAAIVHGWKNARQELDDEYTSGPFSEPALFFYDLRTDSSDYDRDVFWYINDQNGRLHYDVLGDTLTDVLGHPIHYFVNEQECNPGILREFGFDYLAYIKILESDFLSTKKNEFSFVSEPSKPKVLGSPECKTAINVCIYTRKGRDFRTMRGGMNAMTIQGYSQVLPPKPDNINLFWHPIETGHSFRISFHNGETPKRFRVKMEGVSATGDVIHYETVIQQ
jgi:hypothetical protein